MADRALTTREVARMLGVSPACLQLWRNDGKGPAFVKYGDGPKSSVRYMLTDVEAFIQERKRG
jgi:predicted DNA-binding transcriptional regulator AlpA